MQSFGSQTAMLSIIFRRHSIINPWSTRCSEGAFNINAHIQQLFDWIRRIQDQFILMCCKKCSTDRSSWIIKHIIKKQEVLLESIWISGSEGSKILVINWSHQFITSNWPYSLFVDQKDPNHHLNYLEARSASWVAVHLQSRRSTSSSSQMLLTSNLIDANWINLPFRFELMRLYISCLWRNC